MFVVSRRKFRTACLLVLASTALSILTIACGSEATLTFTPTPTLTPTPIPSPAFTPTPTLTLMPTPTYIPRPTVVRRIGDSITRHYSHPPFGYRPKLTGECIRREPAYIALLTPELTSPETDRAALIALYRSITMEGQTMPWKIRLPMETWTGVSVDNNGRVVKLDLSQKELEGELPPELGNLTSLQSLDLSLNSLRGELPPELGNLTNLQSLDLSRNELCGGIPAELGNLTSLETCLLYTSPSPRDGLLSRMPSSA